MRKFPARAAIVTVVLLLEVFGAFRVYGETYGTALAKVFESLSTAKIWNVIYISNHPTSQIVVLYYVRGYGHSESIRVFSIYGQNVHVIWNLKQVPLFMGVIDPNDLRVIPTSAGPAITLHGCAPHDCGGYEGRGVAGAFIYLINSGQFYTASAMWDNTTNQAKFAYSHHEKSGEPRFVRRCLNEMLKKEGYNPEVK